MAPSVDGFMRAVESLELLVDDAVPRHATRVVWYDGNEDLAARAAARMVAFGYRNVALLDGRGDRC